MLKREHDELAATVRGLRAAFEVALDKMFDMDCDGYDCSCERDDAREALDKTPAEWLAGEGKG